MDYIYSKNRKHHQRAVNRVVRRINKWLEKDELWRGRFVIRQKDARFILYEDGSGATLNVLFRFYDKKTGITKDIWADSCSITMWGGTKLFWSINDFIIYTCKVWDNKEDSPYLDKTDYSKIKI